MMEKKSLIEYFKTLGIDVHTKTKARGHQGFFLKNRIDVSKNIPEEKIVPTLLHEFAHYVNYCMDKNLHKTGGSLEVLFKTSESDIFEELVKVTNFVDQNSLCVRLFEHKDRVKNKIKAEESIIKADYPNFMRSKKFKEFDRFIKHSNAKYLLKYDRVKIIDRGFFKSSIKYYSIDNIEQDFPDIKKAFAAYIRLKSLQRKQARISSRINKYNKYYQQPTELFARFVEGIYLDKEWVEAIAPNTFERFVELLNIGYYPEIRFVFNNILKINI